jgi:hypothetical protein
MKSNGNEGRTEKKTGRKEENEEYICIYISVTLEGSHKAAKRSLNATVAHTGFNLHLVLL